MMIKRLLLKNWKNFSSVDISFQSRMFIVGPNASGKSNFLDVFRFLHDISKQGGSLFDALERRGGISKLRCLAARTNSQIEIEVHIEEPGETPVNWIYRLGINRQPHGKHDPCVSYEIVIKNGETILSRPDVDDRKDETLLSQTHLEQTSANGKFRVLASFLSDIRYFHIVPQLIRHPQAFTGPNLPDDPYGRNFLELLAKTPENTRNSRLKNIEKRLRILVPHLTELSFTTDKFGIPHLEARYEHWRPRAGKQQEEQFSDGTLRLIGLLWSLLEPRDSPLILEEPELSLNIAIVRELPKIMYELDKATRRKRQVFISTHSADLIWDKSISAEEVIILKPGNESSEAVLASSNTEIRGLLEAGFPISDIILQYTAPESMKQAYLEEFFHV
ncbi:AAA family ATPase [Methanospirillum hungatei]|uniref:AAA family ATPase n=1 Tax=Methanospirillum hungatei TaxID=2203 RepID=UPI0026F1B0E3|nr:ATP-binding protein [Methanospirillum hungatei]MCA1916610.1 AAA family ATPase [Methanospirillum hungatei]